jgi:hypothetical protein
MSSRVFTVSGPDHSKIDDVVMKLRINDSAQQPDDYIVVNLSFAHIIEVSVVVAIVNLKCVFL